MMIARGRIDTGAPKMIPIHCSNKSLIIRADFFYLEKYSDGNEITSCKNFSPSV